MTRRTGVWLLASGLTAASLLLPFWGFRMSAPQYPDEDLYLKVTRHGISGDVKEIATLQRFIGVEFPENLPELDWIVPVVLALAVLLAIGGLAGAGKYARMFRWMVAAVFGVFLITSAAVVQWRLYNVGHERNDDAPLTAMKDFTPIVVGPTQVGNFSVWSFPHVGGVMLACSAMLATVGARRCKQ
jgi:hypothetical protein